MKIDEEISIVVEAELSITYFVTRVLHKMKGRKGVMTWKRATEHEMGGFHFVSDRKGQKGLS